jgi:hypothetical protein
MNKAAPTRRSRNPFGVLWGAPTRASRVGRGAADPSLEPQPLRGNPNRKAQTLESAGGSANRTPKGNREAVPALAKGWREAQTLVETSGRANRTPKGFRNKPKDNREAQTLENAGGSANRTPKGNREAVPALAKGWREAQTLENASGRTNRTPKGFRNKPNGNRESGQTIVIAIIIMGLMLIMGFVFLGILRHSLNTSSFLQNRSQADDLSEAGIRYVHQQMLRSDLGADWRGQPTPMIDLNVGAAGGPADPSNDTTVDPDAYYLRPPATANGSVAAWPTTGQPDLGGPDGLGPFFRVNFQNGRALVRVRWAPSDPNVFTSSPAGPLRNPGAARNYVILESVGREGILTPNDPTIVMNNTRVRYRNFADAADLQNSLNIMQGAQAKYGSVQVIRAFLPIGIIETSRFITNKYHQSIPAEIGVISNMGANYRGIDVASTDLPTQMGTSLPLLTLSNTASTPTNPLPVGGSLYSNADLMIHGTVNTFLNPTLGDGWFVAGNISGDGNLFINEAAWNALSQTWGTNSLGGAPVNSKSPSYTTYLGLIRDGSTTPDANGIPRAVGRKDPPSADAVDPVTGVNRYLEMTRDSGALVGTGSSGRFGHGQGVYVNNFSDIQGGTDETSRANAGGAGSLINDWLNSNAAGGHWQGFFYVPPAAYVSLLSDGFVITRNPSAPTAEQYWQNPDGSTPTSPTQVLRFRLGRGSDGNLHIVNGQTPNLSNISGNLGATDFDNGPQFNGVLYFQGNVRVRGVIPTDLQLTLVSNATIYVEGSITKGITGNQWTATYTTADNVAPVAVGATLARPSKSMCMLMAKDYVCLNTTQFWGPAPGQTLQPKQDFSSLPAFNPIIMSAVQGSPIYLQADFPYDPLGQPGDGTVPSNPTTFKPYAAGYVSVGTNTKIVTSILLAQTMDQGAGSRSYVEIDVNAGSPLPAGGSSQYLFPTADPPYSNLADQFETGNNIRDYGLGLDNFQTYGNFEQIALPLIDPNNLAVGTGYVKSSASTGTYTAFDQVLNQIRFQPGSFTAQPTNDYLLGRFAIVPADIRIEASMYAEEGSFFIIPGPWFNPNPDDTYSNYLTKQGTAVAATGPSPELDAYRRQYNGASPSMPFFGEPLDARIVISGSVSENMPPPAAIQAEWQRKWGWIPEYLGATSQTLAQQHVPTSNWTVGTTTPWAPNIIIQYDPVLATGRRFGFVDPSSTGNLSDPGTYVRTTWIDYSMTGIKQPNELVPLPPLPRLPVSPTLAYFGEVH